MTILSSASKVVLLLVSLTLCAGFLFSLYRYEVDPAVVIGIFGTFIGAVGQYYFSKGMPSGPSNSL